MKQAEEVLGETDLLRLQQLRDMFLEVRVRVRVRVRDQVRVIGVWELQRERKRVRGFAVSSFLRRIRRAAAAEPQPQS